MSVTDRYIDYDPWAWLYNQSEAHLALKELLPVLEKLLFADLLPQAQIFDLCCGTGQLAQQLTRRGYQVTGLDGSEKMLHYARENAPDATFILDDARFFASPPIFDAAVCTDSSLNHIMSLEELKSVFRNVYNALKPNGAFLFSLGLEKRYRNIPVDDGEFQANYAWTVGETYDPTNQIGTFTITIFQPDHKSLNEKQVQSRSMSQRLKQTVYNHFLRRTKPSTLLHLIDTDWKPLAITFSVKPYSQTEVTSALAEIGFTQINVYDLQGGVAVPTEDQGAYFMARKS